MIEIDCRKCVNADLEADCCKLYGNDPDTAVRECAADEFVNYKESCKQKSIAEIKKSRKNCATEKGHDKTSWRKSFASRDKASI